MLTRYYIRDEYSFSDNLYMRTNMFWLETKELNNHFTAKN